MKKDTITVTVGNFNDLANDFIKAWHDAEAGKRVTLPKEKIYFENAQTLFKALSPARTELLREVHGMGKTSIRALSKSLGRDYKNVYRDVQALLQTGLIIKDQNDDEIFVPWSSIVTEIPMSKAPASTLPHSESHSQKSHARRLR